MPNPTPKLAFSFAVDSPRGTDFFDSIDPPGKPATLHATLLDGSNKTPAMGDISQSFGHRVSKTIHTVLSGPDEFLSGPKRIEYGTRGFDALNDPQVVGLARLQSLQDYSVVLFYWFLLEVVRSLTLLFWPIQLLLQSIHPAHRIVLAEPLCGKKPLSRLSCLSL
jgi:hypothetical protein